MPDTRTVDQVWPAPPMNVWTLAFVDILLGMRAPWQSGGEGGWGVVTAAELRNDGREMLVTIEVDDMMMDPPF